MSMFSFITTVLDAAVIMLGKEIAKLQRKAEGLRQSAAKQRYDATVTDHKADQVDADVNKAAALAAKIKSITE
ncbi:hypothetical protein HOU10_gp26 [Curvibacter phage P26059B]|uniref:Uncharacterized protein n=1 Tax=Curvibacter phage P26059B TaxID=1983784 RepID=A0A384UH40_9CAUD|nr:hypothetical protein HOU10_gp26 [Curvibacter phage P26059B]ASJ79302.1 hypothetical protein P26059B_0026 [Curvibacter phage P26059B]